MTTIAFAPGYDQWVGQAPETVYGTAETVPTYWTPADSPVYTANQTMLVDGAMRGDMAMEHDQIAGMRYDEVTYKTYFYLDSVFLFLRQLLGGTDTITGSTAPYTHKTSLAAATSNNGQPTGTTIFFNASDKTYQMAGSILKEVKITLASEALATVDLTYIGFPAVEIAAPTNTPTTAAAMPTWNTTITVAGTSTDRYSEVELTYTREVEPIFTINGTQSPGAIYGGPVTVAGTLKAIFAGSTDIDWTNYLANTKPALVVKTSPVGDSVNSITFQLSKVGYDKAPFSATTKFFEISSTIRGLANPTDGVGGGQSPSLVTLVSSAATAI